MLCIAENMQTLFVNNTYLGQEVFNSRTDNWVTATSVFKEILESSSHTLPSAQRWGVSCTNQEPVSPGALVLSSVGHTPPPAVFPPKSN